MNQILFKTNRNPLDVLSEFIIYMLVVLLFWGININYIPHEWHLFSGWISCVMYFGLFDLVEVINDVE